MDICYKCSAVPSGHRIMERKMERKALVMANPVQFPTTCSDEQNLEFEKCFMNGSPIKKTNL